MRSNFLLNFTFNWRQLKHFPQALLGLYFLFCIGHARYIRQLKRLVHPNPSATPRNRKVSALQPCLTWHPPVFAIVEDIRGKTKRGGWRYTTYAQASVLHHASTKRRRLLLRLQWRVVHWSYGFRCWCRWMNWSSRSYCSASGVFCFRGLSNEGPASSPGSRSSTHGATKHFTILRCKSVGLECLDFNDSSWWTS